MKTIIDNKICVKHKMTPQEVLIALAVRTGCFESILDNMVGREILVHKEGQYLVTQHWSEELDEILADSAGTGKTDEELLNLAKQIRECFPQGRMRDERGALTPYYYRVSPNAILRSLKTFFSKGAYKDATNEEIIEATKRYVASFRGIYNGKMRQSNYFVWKNDASDLETWLGNAGSEEEEGVSNDDWTTKLI